MRARGEKKIWPLIIFIDVCMLHFYPYIQNKDENIHRYASTQLKEGKVGREREYERARERDQERIDR